jgi:hypothetical protein
MMIADIVTIVSEATADTVDIQTLLTVEDSLAIVDQNWTYGANSSGVKMSSPPSFAPSSRTKKCHARSLAGP